MEDAVADAAEAVAATCSVAPHLAREAERGRDNFHLP